MKGTLLLLPALAVILTTAVPAQTLSISELFGFPCPNGVCPDGLQPSVLIQASDANFYGVTGGSGGIYKITASGQVTVLYTFQQDRKTGLYDQGESPVALVEGSDGFLYGLNNQGGPNPSSAGTLFKISKAGTGFQVLQIFCTTCANGSFPNNLTAAERRQPVWDDRGWRIHLDNRCLPESWLRRSVPRHATWKLRGSACPGWDQ